MSEPRRFRFKTFKWHCDVWFHDNRIESAWDEWGLGVSKGGKTVLKEQIQPHLSETKAFGFRAGTPLKRAVVSACVAAAIYFFAPGAWARWALLPLLAALYPAFIGIRRLQTTQWLNIQTKDGKVALALNVSTWNGAEIEEFRSFFSNWIK
jgi:hypothetical protein